MGQKNLELVSASSSRVHGAVEEATQHFHHRVSSSMKSASNQLVAQPPIEVPGLTFVALVHEID